MKFEIEIDDMQAEIMTRAGALWGYTLPQAVQAAMDSTVTSFSELMTRLDENA